MVGSFLASARADDEAEHYKARASVDLGSIVADCGRRSAAHMPPSSRGRRRWSAALDGACGRRHVRGDGDLRDNDDAQNV